MKPATFVFAIVLVWPTLVSPGFPRDEPAESRMRNVNDARTLAPVEGGAGAAAHFHFESKQAGMPLQENDALCAGCGR